MSIGTKDQLPILAETELERAKGERLVASLPVRRQPHINDNIDEEFFKLDEEEEEQKRRPIDFYTDDVNFDDADDTFLSTVDEEETEENTPRTEHLIASSVPIQIMKPNQKHIDGVEGLAPLRKIDKEIREGDDDNLGEILSVREQTIFKNMQRLSFSVQPEDGPERLWGDHADWEDERRRRRCSFTQKINEAEEIPSRNIDHSRFATTAPQAPIHTPKEAFIVRPSFNGHVKTPGSIKRPGQVPSQPFGFQPNRAPREVESHALQNFQNPSDAQLSQSERNDSAESRHRTDTVDGVQRQPKM
ncbi:unnamed protein product [Bursaphelenchus okinawaensis]|uniref:Uncharacterized protein n=1 Tax=Bursaphelenchus okinawaensis TaxID=465554 RepID=A0A811KL18_9BILA|nr:unnamed protein product [Bursaphelenchus okinawaensis]CAG9105416.1 unnamed protein product [Bursaphelenchus okinawaensis]